MKRDFDLIRRILLEVEGWPANRHAQPFTMVGYDEDIVFEHLELLQSKGLINAALGRVDNAPRRIIVAHVRSLTWQGHEFLDNARNEEVWSKTKEIVKDKGGSASFEIFTGVMTSVAMKIFGLG